MAMSENEHASGPWKTEDSRGRGNNLLRVVDAQGRGIANIRATIHAQANARLIAAAPEMLEALLAFTAKIDSVVLVEPAHPHSDLAEELRKAMAAMAKATGEA